MTEVIFLRIHGAVASIVKLHYLIYSCTIAGGQECILAENKVSAYMYTHMVRILQLSTVRVARKYFFSVNLMSSLKTGLAN